LSFEPLEQISRLRGVKRKTRDKFSIKAEKVNRYESAAPQLHCNT